MIRYNKMKEYNSTKNRQLERGKKKIVDEMVQLNGAI